MALFGKKNKADKKGKADGFLDPAKDTFLGPDKGLSEELDLDELGSVTGGVRLSHENIYGSKENDKGAKR